MITETEKTDQPGIDDTEGAVPQTGTRRRRGRRVAGVILFAVVAIAAVWYFYGRGSEDTDDAQVDGHLVPVASRIDGTIQAVHVDDNQTVSVGQLLVELDPKDNEVALHQAKHDATRPLLNLLRWGRMSQSLRLQINPIWIPAERKLPPRKRPWRPPARIWSLLLPS